MNTKLKSKIKHLLGYNDIVKKEDYYSKESIALQNFLKENPEYASDLHDLGKRPDGKDFSPGIKKITDGFVVLNQDLKKLANDNLPDIFEYDGLHSGTPMRYKPYMGCIRNIRRVLHHNNLYWYPNAQGGRYDRQKIVDYLVSEHLFDNSKKDKEVGVDNVIFTYSTTHAFYLILDTIAKPNDVILVTGPNYGLFAVKPENINQRVEIIDLE